MTKAVQFLEKAYETFETSKSKHVTKMQLVPFHSLTSSGKKIIKEKTNNYGMLFSENKNVYCICFVFLTLYHSFVLNL